jgi:hypothetical protein
MIAMYFTGLLLAVSYPVPPGWAFHPLVEATRPLLDIRPPTSPPDPAGAMGYGRGTSLIVVAWAVGATIGST